MSNDKMMIWGEVYGVLHRAIPGGLTPVALNRAAGLPGEHFGATHGRAMPHLAPEDFSRLTELLTNISPDDLRGGPVPEVEQSAFWLGFYRAGPAVPGSPKQGRPTGGAAIDWSGVDWSLPNAEIARQKHCSVSTVRDRRAKLEKEK